MPKSFQKINFHRLAPNISSVLTADFADCQKISCVLKIPENIVSPAIIVVLRKAFLNFQTEKLIFIFLSAFIDRLIFNNKLSLLFIARVIIIISTSTLYFKTFASKFKAFGSYTKRGSK